MLMKVNMSDDKTGCTSCRLIGGFGFIGIGLYVGYVGSKNANNPYSRLIIGLIGASFAGIGTARLLNLPPFKTRKKVAPE
ncbi:uncharacterized protein LOC142325261 [Lycorma delicatula]|uniref:uncharacterized protein LOC142325261 n=1 Tax=Lycorma delicatula TaxID=130591 RepID=UPI003F513FE6